MNNKIAFTLAAVLIISISINIVQFSQVKQLRDAFQSRSPDSVVIDKKVQNPDKESESSSTSQGKDNAVYSDNHYKNKDNSIKAVAVKPVTMGYGFYQTTKYEGSIMRIELDIKEGSGLILVNTEIPTGVDFQTSARTATAVAKDLIPGVDLSSKDIIFSITSDDTEDLEAVDGPSAGAAMASLLISKLQGKKINENVVITGSIKPDGMIGKVGGVPEKAIVAGQHGADIFLVPSGQGSYQSESCEENQQGSFIYRTCRTFDNRLTDITESTFNMKTVEISHIENALQYIQS